MRVAFWDLETTDLKALMGRLLSAAFVGLDGEPIVYRSDDSRFKSRNKLDDSKLAVATRDYLEAHDLIVGHNIRLFDIPFLNARLAKAGQRPLKTHFVMDTLYYCKGAAMRIGSAKLDNVQKFFGLSEAKTPISWETWQQAALGDRAAMDEVVKHNIQDVLVLRELYPLLLPYVSTLHR